MSFFNCDHWIVLASDDISRANKVIDEKLQYIKAGRRRKRDPSSLHDEKAIRLGMQGEIAASLYFDLKWLVDDLNQSMVGDLEFGVEVKATDWPTGGLMCGEQARVDYVRKSQNTPVLCVRIDAWPWVEFPGWVYAKDLVKFPFTPKQSFHQKGFFVPPNRLQPISEFIKLIEYWRSCKNR